MKDKLYYKDGTTSDKTIFSKVLHREDGPAVEYASGSRDWYLNGKLHREDGPAVELADGSKAWWLNGKLHREDGPAIEYADGSREWWLNNKIHREDGPAVEYPNGSKGWFLNDKPLRTLTKKHLIKYMEVYNLTLAHLLTDSDEIVRASVIKYKWKRQRL